MLNLKKLDRLFAKGNINPTEDQFLAMLRAAALMKADLHLEVPEWSKEELSEALHGKKPLFAEHIVPMPQQEYLRVFKALKDAVGAACFSAQAWEGMPEPEVLFTQENLDAMGKNPEVLWDVLERAGVDLNRAQEQLVPVAAFAMRVFFEEAAVQASEAMDRLVPDTVHFSRSVSCPVCGMRAAMAGVGATQNRGNVKRLHCSCCGASWQFERIRCAICGTEAASDLQYVHLQGDDKHRLHVCAACGGAVPTVFGAESDDFDPDFETWRCAELIVAFQEKRAEAQKEDAKAGNA